MVKYRATFCFSRNYKTIELKCCGIIVLMNLSVLFGRLLCPPIKQTIMRKVLFVFALLVLMPAISQAQTVRVTQPVDWEKVQKVAEKDPQRIKGLVARLSANEIDTTMTLNARILAYYGQSYLTPMTELNEGIKLDKLLKDGKYEECLSGAKDLLKKNPVSLKALSNALYAMMYMLQDSTNQYGVSRDEARTYYIRMHRVLNTIGATGDGTQERPFYVTAVSDEYLFMRHNLEIGKTKMQYITEHYDVFELEETSEYYTRPKLFFDITRVLEIEKEMLNKD